MRVEKEIIERINKTKEGIRLLNEQMNAPRRPHETSRLGYAKFLLGAKKGDPSKKGEKWNAKNKKLTYYH